MANESYTDREIIYCVQAYRNLPHVSDKWGPTSLEVLGSLMRSELGLEYLPARSNLSLRIRSLIRRGHLRALGGPGPRGFITATLQVTAEGKRLIEEAT